MHIADSYILHLLFGEEERELLQGPLRPILLAAHVFLYLMMRQVPKNGAVMRALVHRLDNSIQMRQTEPSVWENHLPALLWVLFVGAVAQEPLVEGIAKHWMKTQLRDTCRLLVPATKESIRDTLKGFLWCEKSCAPFFDKFWDFEFGDH